MDERVLNKKDSISFENEFDYKPLKKGAFANIEEKIFGLMRGKKKAPIVQKSSPNISPPLQALPQQSYELPLIRRKDTVEIVKTQLKFPAITKTGAVINGLSLAVFAIGAYLIYAELPTHPNIIIGLILVSIAGNVIVSAR